MLKEIPQTTSRYPISLPATGYRVHTSLSRPLNPPILGGFEIPVPPKVGGLNAAFVSQKRDVCTRQQQRGEAR